MASRIASVAVALALVGCAARREPAPLGPSFEPAEVAAPSAPSGAGRPLIEEDLPAEPAGSPAPGVAGSEGSGALTVDPPSVLATIGGGTAPNVAAATRLVDAGRARMADGRQGEALEQFERAIAIDPSNFYAYYFLAELHLSHRTYDQAIAFADRAASLSAGADPGWVSRAYSLQGNAFEAAGRFADARRAYQRALDAAPGNLAAQVGLARVGGDSGATR